MNKKINPLIFRISIKNDWTSKFIEKKIIELNTFIFQRDEIVNFTNRFFNKYGLIINNFKLYYKKNLIHIFINYNMIKFLRKRNLFLSKNFNQHLKLSNHLILFKTSTLNLKKYFKNKYSIKISKLIKIKFINNSIFISLMPKRINFLKFIHVFKFKFKNIQEIYSVNNFITKLLINLQVFLNYKTNIFITVKQVDKNNNFKFLSQEKKRKLLFTVLKIRKFEKNNKFFAPNLNFIYIFKGLQKKSILILEFLNLLLNNSKNFKILNFFFKFFENTLKQFLLKFSIIKGIIIILKGNLNKTTRSIKKVIKIGNLINNLKINNNIDFNQKTFFTIKGTIGCKVFIKH